MTQDKPHGWLAGEVSRFSEMLDHWGATAPDRVAIVNRDVSLTFGELARDAARLADALSDLGLGPRDRMFAVGENTVGAVLLVFAANRIGASLTLVNARMQTSEIEVLQGFGDPKLSVFATEGSPKTAEHAEALGAKPLNLDTVGGDIRVLPGNAKAEPNEDRGSTGADIAMIMFTSGTTGTPKGVMITNDTMLAQAKSQCFTRAIGPEDTFYVVSPMSHQIGLSGSVISSICAGARMVLPPRHDPDLLVRMVADGEVTVLVGVPQLYNGLLDHADREGIDLSGARLRIAGCGGAPLDPALKARALDRLGVILGNGYGSTEFVPASRVPPGAEVAPNVVGKLEAGVECRIVDEAGNDLPDGEDGEIWVRGPFMMAGYFRNPQATAEVMRDGGWLATGDIGVMRDGMLAITGRKKEIIIRSGFNVYPTDVEAALTAHPDVNMAAVLGRSVPGNEEIVGFVTALPGRKLDPAEVRDFTRRTLTPYKVPSEVIVLDEMPVGPTGKILKTALKPKL
ncbi:hypothetical protein ATO6_14130 [Oceanicola sp. 22II-s10i]|uniref:class I adenylate-forming enzyme family protein n=1 Tax=Oceanicola sp. 22II-s10i TaxID=1317116 RepID=UPI000B735444|nr:class I adenylate-forming enzyme family protein [Oceanicola sp. 22II-s10i]OWU84186.1 hypothetical protein ATO6_14130 [Oceanicola sp. 22II-s10i]